MIPQTNTPTQSDLGITSFLDCLRKNSINFYTGVPCSILAPLISRLEQDTSLGYLPATREDLAVGMAAGAYLAGRNPCVLMQNSGLGYSLNAFTSLNLIFKIPVLLIIGYRGAGPDAPEHWVMGRSCTKLLEAIGIPYWVPEKETLLQDTTQALQIMQKERIPSALLLKAGIFTLTVS